ncbi:MAG: hypothetical protein WCA37_16300 [Terracidiphilus sp.]
MRPSICVASSLSLLMMMSCALIAQSAPPGSPDEPKAEPRGSLYLSIPIAIPLNPAAQAVNLGFGLTVGGGYRLARHQVAVGEFMWNNLFPNGTTLTRIRTTLDDPKANASVGVMGLTANYRYELEGKKLGTYLIGGGGLYYRHTSLSESVITSSSIPCTPTWQWLGFTCTNGYVTPNQKLGNWSATSGGINGGVGFTTKFGEAPCQFYVESRYHYAPSGRVNTQLINIAFGIRY